MKRADRRTFSDDESARVMALHRQGMNAVEIAEQLGDGREGHSVAGHIRWMKPPPAKRHFRREQINEARRCRAFGRPAGSAEHPHSAKPTADLIADRDRRLSRPFSIGMDLLGEPEPGRSALDKKRAEQTA